MIKSSPAQNPMSFLVMSLITIGILFDFGWFREQFCTVVCPYGRFQSLLMDSNSLLISYDSKRGEPRKGAIDTSSTGDCVNCYRCVQVCPTGIDIRRGAQLECIACAACIDACDDVMTRLRKPIGLIRYDSAVGLTGGKTTFLRGRVIAYTGLLIAIVTSLAYTLITRHPIESTFMRSADMPYQQIANEKGDPIIINHFRLALGNQSFSDSTITIRPLAEFGAKGVELIMANSPIILPAGTKTAVEFFLKYPKALLSHGKTLIRVEIVSSTSNTYSESLSLVGPY